MAIVKLEMNQRGFAPILIVVAIAVIAVGAFLVGRSTNSNPQADLQSSSPAPTSQFSPTTVDDLSTWKTYTNSEYNFDLKYPPDLSVSEETKNSENSTSVVFGCTGQEVGYCLPPYGISVIPNFNNKQDDVYNKIFSLKVGEELDQEVAYEIAGKWDFSTKFKRLDDVIVKGERFLVLDNPKWYGGANKILFLKKNNKIYRISTIYQSNEQLATFEKIYSTFKFTK